MSLFISSLNSGSNGNCYYIGNQHEAVLIDAGLSCRETEMRIARSGLSMSKIKAVFISHEHSDHTRGTAVITRKYRIPVYLSAGTYKNSRLHLDTSLIRYFDSNIPVNIGGLSINAFPKQHDASEPHSFTVTGNGITIGVLTDIGAACDQVIKNFSECHAAFLEANYDEDMLENGRYPIYLKKRIRSDHGHLSNHQSLELFTTHKPAFMSHLLLSHLSQDNNNPRLVHDLFRKHAGDTHIAIASRHQESKVYCITGVKATGNYITDNKPSRQPFQLNLFE
jgi:phosphoribosyl 1,2-cyclic phosphodiesterase